MSSVAKFPQYKCHKIVGALQIKKIYEDGSGSETTGSLRVDFVNPAYESMRFDAEWNHKHKPFVWGYIVQYEDGYLSFSPQKAFEDGYTLLENQ